MNNACLDYPIQLRSNPAMFAHLILPVDLTMEEVVRLIRFIEQLAEDK